MSEQIENVSTLNEALEKVRQANEVLVRFSEPPYELHKRADDAGALWRAMQEVLKQ